MKVKLKKILMVLIFKIDEKKIASILRKLTILSLPAKQITLFLLFFTAGCLRY